MPRMEKRTALLAAAALALLAPCAWAVRFNMRYDGTPLPGVSLNGKSYTGTSREDAKADLERVIAERYKGGMTLSYQDQTFIVQLTELGISIDTDESIAAIFDFGHRKDFLASLQEQASLIGSPADFENRLSFKDFLIESSRWQEIAAIETPAKDFSYEFEKSDFVPTAATEGFVIDQDKLRRDIENNLLDLRNDAIEISLIADEPTIREDVGQKGLARARNLLTFGLTLAHGEDSWSVTKEELGNWISFSPATEADGTTALVPSPDRNSIKDYLVTIIPQINSEPVNAQLEFKDGKVSVFALSQDGVELDLEASAQAIGEAVFRSVYYLAPADPGGKMIVDGKEVIQTGTEPIWIELVVNNVSPELTTENIDNMGITSLLATGESNFVGSTKSRIHNITVGASKFNGALIGPGDTFSFNSILGNVGAKEGYLPELVIKQGQTIAEYGGGLCQVSTTAFRGAVSAGLEITERKNHAYAVKYYSPQGTDATIYPPHPDLQFINNTPNYILIQTRISGTRLYFDFYGTTDGRKVETEGPVIYERGTGGAMKTWWKQKVYDKDGNLFLEKTFYSNYKSPELYPKTNPLE